MTVTGKYCAFHPGKNATVITVSRRTAWICMKYVIEWAHETKELTGTMCTQIGGDTLIFEHPDWPEGTRSTIQFVWGGVLDPEEYPDSHDDDKQTE